MMKLKKTEKLQIQNLRILTPTQEKARVLLAAVIPLRKFAWQLCGGIASPKPLVAGLYLWRSSFHAFITAQFIYYPVKSTWELWVIMGSCVL